MLIPNADHPNDERLSALASGDTDATADTSLTAHVSTCDRCTEVVDDLGALRASLAELPDLRPHRPLRLLPEVTEPDGSRADRLGGWARRIFAPVLTAGAALALVGVVGTAAPATFQGAGGAAGESVALFGADDDPDEPTTMEDAAGGAGEAGDGANAEDAQLEAMTPNPDTVSAAGRNAEPSATDEADDGATQLPAERSPWPMVLFAGVALMVVAALLRWILVPRAG